MISAFTGFPVLWYRQVNSSTTATNTIPETCQRSISAPAFRMAGSFMNTRIMGSASRKINRDSPAPREHRNVTQNRSSLFSFSRSRAPYRYPNSGTPPKEKPTSTSCTIITIRVTIPSAAILSLP